MMRFFLSVCGFIVTAVIYLLWSNNSHIEGQAELSVSGNDVEVFLSGIKGRMVFVEGGSFLMGDFGTAHLNEGLPLDSSTDSKPLHKVTLNSYSIDKYKITNEDFDFYLKYKGCTRRKDVPSGMYSLFGSQPRLPANIDWFEAEKYCGWLREISSLPFSMMTEAQWEYAARNRGEFIMVATDDGTYRYRTSAEGTVYGVNISASRDREDFAMSLGWDTRWATALPVDHYPPNGLGVYSMSDNGREWVKDWYDPEFYTYSPEVDPQGPDKPMHKDYLGRYTKVMRGQSSANENWTLGINVHRFPVSADGYGSSNKKANLSGKTSRCVVNEHEPLM